MIPSNVPLTFSVVALCLGTGLLVGIAYFGGLWLTVKNLKDSEHPTKTLLTSWFLRNGLFVLSLWAVMRGDWRRALIAFGAFLSVKVVMTQMFKLSLKKSGKGF